MPVSIPPFSNVPAAGDGVQSAWAQQLTQYSVDHGVIYCTSTTRPTGAAGKVIYETDTKRIKYHDGTGWIILSEPLQGPVLLSGGNMTMGAGQVNCTFQRSNGWIDVSIAANFGAGFAIYSDPHIILPIAGKAPPSGMHGTNAALWRCVYYVSTTGIFMGHVSTNDSDKVRPMIQTSLNGAAVAITTTTPATWAAGSAIWMDGRYRIDPYST